MKILEHGSCKKVDDTSKLTITKGEGNQMVEDTERWMIPKGEGYKKVEVIRRR